ncbi:MAG: DNA repair protein RadA [Phycisphaerales bacterium]|nr:DNA repair protein RadA [Phycisphaerales bacterium]
MAKPKHIFICRSCGCAQPRWTGKCPDCGQWDTLEEEVVELSATKDPQRGLVRAWAEAQDASGAPAPTIAGVATPIDHIDAAGGPSERLATGLDEFDRVLGGTKNSLGLVPGSAVLIGGEPGIGKSTLMLQAAHAWATRGVRTLYVSSEESAEQIKLRSQRLARDKAGPDLLVLADTNLARIVEQARKTTPRVLVIDSIQMIYKADLDAAPGSIAQLRRCSAELVYLAKLSGIAVVMVGHVTKDGQLAGPRLLEHLVDTVLYFEGDRYHAHRIVRAVKNRFGTTLELGLFEMTAGGLAPVAEGASALPAAETKPRPGSAVCPVVAGTRCHMVELQALTATGFLGAAKRKSSGLDANRLAMLIAVLEQHAGLRLADRDVFASAVGGIRVVEPASDLALSLAIAGAHFKRALPAATAVIGEVGLGGEVRAVSHMEQRCLEAARLGYTTLLVPRVKGLDTQRLAKSAKGTIIECPDIAKAIDLLS